MPSSLDHFKDETFLCQAIVIPLKSHPYDIISLQATKPKLFIVTSTTNGGGVTTPLRFSVRFKILYRVIQRLIQPEG